MQEIVGGVNWPLSNFGVFRISQIDYKFGELQILHSGKMQNPSYEVQVAASLSNALFEWDMRTHTIKNFYSYY